ncbi:MAG: DUF1697 domain-containing protein [Methanoregula sp.]|nr:DUF1697 domain-containing protein [Methanoregula sp.]
MKTYIVLLRGVTQSGKNKVPMVRLREVLSRVGFGNVRTYIQSGNAFVDTELSAREVGKSVRELIKKHIGPDLAVVVSTGTELQKVLDDNPFQQDHDISRVFFVLFTHIPAEENVKELLAQDFGDEKLAITKTKDAAYMYIPGAYGRGILSNNFLEKKLGVSATMRNFNTMSKLVEMSKDQM